jgi:hypothetical protein
MKRVTRPRPSRTAPIRNWSALFGTTARTNAGAEGGEPEREDGRGNLDDALSRSVSLGYRVIDEYMRQGQEAARRLSAGSYGAAALATDVQEAMIRMARHASDFLEVGLQLLDAATDGEQRGREPVAGDDAPEEPTPAHVADPVRLRLEVASNVPTDVAVDLRPEFAGARLVAQALRGIEPTLPPLTDVTIQRGDDEAPLTLRLRIPDGQPHATYTGVIVEEDTGRPAGTLCVRVGGDSEPMANAGR